MTTSTSFTEIQGQYLAFIHAYSLVMGQPPAEADIQRFFGVTPPSVHNMVMTLEGSDSSPAHRGRREASRSWCRRTSYPASGNRSKPLG